MYPSSKMAVYLVLCTSTGIDYRCSTCNQICQQKDNVYANTTIFFVEHCIGDLYFTLAPTLLVCSYRPFL